MKRNIFNQLIKLLPGQKKKYVSNQIREKIKQVHKQNGTPPVCNKKKKKQKKQREGKMKKQFPVQGLWLNVLERK